MTVHYLLDCESCQHQIELAPTQAGQSLECPNCRASCHAPKLGTLKMLPTVAGDTAGKAGRSGQSSRLKSVLFASGLSVAVFAGLAGLGLHWYGSSMYTDIHLEQKIEQLSSDIDRMAPAQLWDLWHHDDIEEEMGEWMELPFARYNAQSAILKKIAYGMLGIAGAGLLTTVGALLIKTKDT